MAENYLKMLKTWHDKKLMQSVEQSHLKISVLFFLIGFATLVLGFFLLEKIGVANILVVAGALLIGANIEKIISHKLRQEAIAVIKQRSQ